MIIGDHLIFNNQLMSTIARSSHPILILHDLLPIPCNQISVDDIVTRNKRLKAQSRNF